MRRFIGVITAIALVFITSSAFGGVLEDRIAKRKALVQQYMKQHMKRIQGACTYHGGLNDSGTGCNDGWDGESSYGDPEKEAEYKEKTTVERQNTSGCGYHGGFAEGTGKQCADGSSPIEGPPPLPKPVPKEFRENVESKQSKLEDYIKNQCAGDPDPKICAAAADKHGEGAELRKEADDACRKAQKYDSLYPCYTSDSKPEYNYGDTGSIFGSGGGSSSGSGSGSGSNNKPKPPAKPPSTKPPSPKQQAAAVAKAEKAAKAAADKAIKEQAARCKKATALLEKSEKAPEWKKIQAHPSFGKSLAECDSVTDPKYDEALVKKCDKYKPEEVDPENCDKETGECPETETETDLTCDMETGECEEIPGCNPDTGICEPGSKVKAKKNINAKRSAKAKASWANVKAAKATAKPTKPTAKKDERTKEKYDACLTAFASSYKKPRNTPAECQKIYEDTQYWQSTIETLNAAKTSACK